MSRFASADFVVHSNLPEPAAARTEPAATKTAATTTMEMRLIIGLNPLVHSRERQCPGGTTRIRGNLRRGDELVPSRVSVRLAHPRGRAEEDLQTSALPALVVGQPPQESVGIGALLGHSWERAYSEGGSESLG